MNMSNMYNSNMLMWMLSIVRSNVDKYIVCSDLWLWYNWGFIILVLMIIQIIWGLVISTLYWWYSGYWWLISLTRDIYYGINIRQLHGSLPTLIQLGILYHIGRGIVYNSIGYVSSLWIWGIVLYLCVCLICYMGYVLPYGQIWYWGVMVIMSILPNMIREWVFGDTVITVRCVNRYYILHYLIPLLSLLLIIVHMYYLHYVDGSVSSNSTKGNSSISSIVSITFYPLMVIKDCWYMCLVIMLIVMLTLDHNQSWNHGDNNDEANSLKTPIHIVPEWYFLYLYAVLKCIPEFYSGIITMVVMICSLLILLLTWYLYSSKWLIRRVTLWTCVMLFIVYFWLVYVGQDFPTLESTSAGRMILMWYCLILTSMMYVLY